METAWRVITRKKLLDPVSVEQSELGRVLNAFDLTALGVGSTLGVGVYVLAGQVAKDIAGPAVILSFLIATIASVFAGLCYAEFGARAPRAGSAYIYSYVCVGEFIAFVIGWNLILEYVIGSASVARGLSLYLDTLLNNTLKDTFLDIAPIENIDFMSAYFDFFAFGISILLAIALAFGLKESSWANNIFTLVNIGVVIFVVIAGATKSNVDNWNLNVTNSTIGDGGFMPFGVEGVIKGAATCFYGFVGFDCIATTGEEVKNPKKAIPFAIIVSLFIIFLAYFGTSTVVTLMVPYYAQDPNAPLPHAFVEVGLDWAKWVVAIGGIFGLCASLFGAMFPLPRIIYAMASDSLIFQFLGRVSQKFKTPVTGTLLAGVLTGLMGALFELKQLVNMMSIGTLLAYTIVAASVLLLRYEADKIDLYQPLIRSDDSDESDIYTTEDRGLDVGQTNEDLDMLNRNYDQTDSYLKQIFNCGRRDLPSKISERIVKIHVCFYCVLCVLIGLCAIYFKEAIVEGKIHAIVLTSIPVALAVLLVMSMMSQPKSRRELSFKVPLVPLIPALSILINIYLMLMLDKNTWIRFGIWMAVGLPTYYFSVKIHSDARNESISSFSSIREKTNGYVNHSYEPTAEEAPKKKQPAPPPPTLEKIEETIANLDEILEKAESDILGRKISVESVSSASNVLREENVKADVHCSNEPVTPVQEDPPLVQSSDVIPEPEIRKCDVVPPLNTTVAANLVDEINASDTISVGQDDDSVQATGDSKDADKEEIMIIPSPPSPPPLIEAEMQTSHETEAIPPPPTETEPITLDEKEEFVVPPPPPMSKLEGVEINIPRPSVKLSAITSAKLKHVEKIAEIPPVDYSRQNTQIAEGGNIKFGSPEYKEFLEKLDKTLLDGYVPTQAVVDLRKKAVCSAPPIPNEDIDEDNIDRDEAKKKLAQFLERTNSLPYMPRNNIESSKWDGVQSNEEAKYIPDYKEEHRKNMENIFRSVRLRKNDSFKDDPPEVKRNSLHVDATTDKKNQSKDDLDLDRLEHKQNMNGIFDSIRSRKVDSFENNESQ